MREELKAMMARAEEAWREYHEDGKVSAWELSERLEAEGNVQLAAGSEVCDARIGFDPIFKDAFVRLFYWERPTRYAVAKLRYFKQFGWELRVTCQGEQSEMERICYELVEEGKP